MYQSDSMTLVQNICKIAPISRSQKHLETLATYIKDIILFKELQQKCGESSYNSCIQHLSYEFHQSEEFLFRYGDPGTKYYILISGTVSILLPATESGYITYREIMTYQSGSSFGELALETNKPRSASAQCKTDSHFLTLSHKDYLRFMQRVVIEKKNEMTSFLHNLPALSKLNKLALSRLTYNIKEVSHTKGQIIFNENDPAKEIFIIKEGECKLTKSIKKPATAVGIKRMLIKRSCTAKRVAKGSMIGEEDVMNKQPHSYSCICCSEIAVFYVIPAVDFFARITADQPLRYMRKISKEKRSFLEGWNSCRASLDNFFISSNKQPIQKISYPEIDNIQKLKIKMLEKMRAGFDNEQKKSNNLAKRHKKVQSHGNLFILTSLG